MRNGPKSGRDCSRCSAIQPGWKAQQPICICDFTADLELSQPTISHHMSKLKDADLVESEKDGIWMYYRLRRDLAPATRRLLSQLVEGGS